MKFRIAFSLCLAFFPFLLRSQALVPLVPGISVDSVMPIVAGACRLEYDPVTGNLFYATNNGNIYEIFMPASGPASAVIRFTALDHGIPSLQGFCFSGTAMVVSGNDNSAGTTTIGYVKKGRLNMNGTRTWTTVASTVPYPLASPGGDHGFSNVFVDPAGQHIFVCSGARTHLGEVRDNGGAWPGLREVPLTTRLFRFPFIAEDILLQNDSLWIESSPYLIASGLRNPYDAAWDAQSELFAIDNSGERDDPDELNWIRPGMHYGYPWLMGGNLNPLVNPGYDVEQDLLVNHNSFGYQNGWFADVPGFPLPSGMSFSAPVRNLGPDADFFRTETGAVTNASDLNTYITTFSPHRSPLGLVFDRSLALGGDYTGDGFLTSFMPCGDSSGYSALSPWGGPVVAVDSCRDVLHLEMVYNDIIDNYELTATSIVRGLWLPVDAVLLDSSLYIIESSNQARLWRIRLPHAPLLSVNDAQQHVSLDLYPNPARDEVGLKWRLPGGTAAEIRVCDLQGREWRRVQLNAGSGLPQVHHLNLQDVPAGAYVVSLASEGQVHATKLMVVE